MASTYTLTSNTYDGRKLVLTCTQTKDTANNRSKISWTLTSTGGNSNYYSTGPTTVKIAGAQRYYKARTAWSTQAFPAAKGSTSGSFYVSHNTNGSKSISVSLTTAIYTSTTSTKSGTWTLDTIPRYATVASASNFTDEKNPEITYKNPAGTAATLAACIADSNGNILVDWKTNVDETKTSYTFSLTDSDRTKLRNHIKTGNSATVRLYLRTTIGGEIIYKSYRSVTLSLVDYTPTLNPTVSNYQQTRDLTGDETTLIRYFSNAKITFGAEARKGATIKSQKVTNSGKSRTTDGDITSVTSGDFAFAITDSRGYSKSVNKNVGFVKYVKPTCSLKVNISVDGEATININGNFFSGKFGESANAIENVLKVQYRYAEAGQALPDWEDVESLTPVMALTDSKAYSIEETLTGLDYNKTYIFQARATDTIYDYYGYYAATTAEKKVKSMPVFDWGEDDFHFHVPISAPNFGREHFSAASNITDKGKLKADGSHEGYFYLLKTFNLVYFRFYIEGFSASIAASSTSGVNIAKFNGKFAPPVTVALSCYGSKNADVALTANAELRVIPKDGLATDSILRISGIYPLNSNSELYI